MKIQPTHDGHDQPPSENDSDPPIVQHRPDSAVPPHAIFLTVETAFLQRLYVLFFISLATRRIEYVACSANPDGDWILQQARNLLMNLDDRGQRPLLLIHDRDSKFSHTFDALFRNDGIRVIRTPVRAPNANAHIERWVGAVRRECLDRLLIFNRGQLERILRVYVRHYNEQRPHRALALLAPDPPATPSPRANPADQSS